MRRWKFLLPLLLLAACQSGNSDKKPNELSKDEMPSYIRDLFRQTEQRPDSVGLRLKLVDALDSLGAYDQALGQMDDLIRKDSLNYGLWYRKAMVQQNGRDTGGALRSLRYAIRIYPSPDAMLNAANLLAEKKDSTALLLANQIISQRLGREYDAHSYFISGVYYARKGDTKKALEAFDACIRTDFNYMEAYMEKGFLFYEAKQTAEAQKIFQAVVNIKNTYADGYYWLAKCQETLQQKSDAIANYQTALKLDPGITEASTALARLGVK